MVYLLLPLVEHLMEVWFIRDLEIRSRLVGRALGRGSEAIVDACSGFFAEERAFENTCEGHGRGTSHGFGDLRLLRTFGREDRRFP